MKLYPINIRLKGKKCLVVGGGSVAARKTARLIECGASVTVISPELAKELEALEVAGSISHVKRVYQEGDCEGFFLIFACTNDDEANLKIGRDAKELGILINIASAGDESAFTTPATKRFDEVLITFSTGNTSPAFSKLIKDEFAELWSDDLRLMAKILSTLRSKLNEGRSTKTAAICREAAESDLLRLIRAKRLDEADCLIKEISGFDLKALGVSLGDPPKKH